MRIASAPPAAASDDAAAELAEVATPIANAPALGAAEEAPAPIAIDPPAVSPIVAACGVSSLMQPDEDDRHGPQDESSYEYADALDTSLAASWGMPRKHGNGKHGAAAAGDESSLTATSGSPGGGDDDESTEDGARFGESLLRASGGRVTACASRSAYEGRARIKTKLGGAWKVSLFDCPYIFANLTHNMTRSS